MSVLNDQNYISQYDPQGALPFAATQPQQLLHSFNISSKKNDVKITNIVFAGMGGSAIHAEFSKTWPELSVPAVVWKNYGLPEFVSSETLVVVSSVSGNTEEALSSLGEAEKKGAQIAIIAHGGKLTERARTGNYLFAEVPPALQPRMAVFYLYRALAEVLIAFGLTEISSIKQLESIVKPLTAATTLWGVQTPFKQNMAKQLAEHAVGKTLIIYSGQLMAPVAYKWKIDANENAKNTAWFNIFPEVSHNEFIGWSSHPVEKPFAVFDLVSDFEHPRVTKRFALTDRLLSGKRPHAVQVEAVGETPLEQMLHLVLLGDFVTLYLAVLNGVNPAPVDLVEKFKAELVKD